MARALKIEDRRGVLVSGIRGGSVAEQAGLQPGDLLRRLERRPVEDIEAFTEICRSLGGDRIERILVEVNRGPILAFHVIKPVYGTDAGRVDPALWKDDGEKEDLP
jgi:S1-C subfamily serine protease